MAAEVSSDENKWKKETGTTMWEMEKRRHQKKKAGGGGGGKVGLKKLQILWGKKEAASEGEKGAEIYRAGEGMREGPSRARFAKRRTRKKQHIPEE